MKIPLPRNTLHVLDFCEKLGVEHTWQCLADGSLPASRLRLSTGQYEPIAASTWSRVVHIPDGNGSTVQKHPFELLAAGDLSWLHPPDPIIVPYFTREELASAGIIRAQPPAVEKNKGGRPGKADWPAIEEAFKQEVATRGFPDPLNEDGWRYQADVVRWIEEMLDREGVEVAPSTCKNWASRFMENARPETSRG